MSESPPDPSPAFIRRMAEQHRREQEWERLANPFTRDDSPDDCVELALLIDSYQPIVHRPMDAYAGDSTAYKPVNIAGAHAYYHAHTELNSWYELELHLKKYGAVADSLGFGDDIPSHTTLSKAWNKRWDDTARSFIEQAAEFAAEDAWQDDRCLAKAITRPPEPAFDADMPGVPNIERAEIDRAYRKVRPVLHDVIDFERAPNSSVPHDDLVEFAGYLSRRNTYPEQGIQRFRAEEEGRGAFSAETFRRAVRNKELNKEQLSTGDTEWLEPFDRTVDLNGEPSGTDDWHSTTEEAIERLVDTLKAENVIDGPVKVSIDGSVRDYHKRDDVPPEGVFNNAYFETNYGWKDLSASAIIDGRSIVLANVSMTKPISRFDAVKYLVDRARELVDVDVFLADSAFSNSDICRYIDSVNEEYIIKKRHHRPVNEAVEEFSGTAGYTSYELQASNRGRRHDTTLFAVEKRATIDPKSKGSTDKDDPQTSISQFGATTSGQSSLSEYTPDEEIEYVAFITNRDIRSVGVDPEEKPIGHNREGTVWKAAQDYRRRWSIETAFRQVKHQFLPKTTSRDLGVRRFYWMLAIILYNSWATMNLLVQTWVPEVSSDRPPVSGNVFLEVLSNDSPPPD